MAAFLNCCWLSFALDCVWGATLQLLPDGEDVGACTEVAPCASLQYAISIAAAGDIIEVGAGRYSGARNRNVDLSVPDLVIRGTAGPGRTFLDLQRSGRGFVLNASAGAARIEGLTLVNGMCSVARPHGAAFYLEGSSATIADVVIRNMNCTATSVDFGRFSGGAFYLRDSVAIIENIAATDCAANHGGGIAVWGADRSIVRDSTFEGMIGRGWGGCTYMEDDSGTEFRGVKFSRCESPYGAGVDDGGTAHCFFKECVFEYSIGMTGSVGFHFGFTRTRYEDCTFRHNSAASASHYVTSNARPSFTNCTFLNNSASVIAGCLRSFYRGGQGLLLVDGCSFISNTADAAAVAVVQIRVHGAVQFRDCLFEGNEATSTRTGAVQIEVPSEVQTGVSNAPLFLRSQFVRNRAATDGGAVTISYFGINAISSELIEGCTFEGNIAGKAGGAIASFGPVQLSMSASTFARNQAKTDGGAISFANQDLLTVSQLQIRTSTFDGNSAAAHGGALHCVDREGASTGLTLMDTDFNANTVLGDGGAVSFDCMRLRVSGGSFTANCAKSGNGGALALGQNLICDGGATDTVFREVTFKDNEASVGGGLTFFNHLSPACRLPLLPDGSLNSIENGTWFWSDATASVSNNRASYGALQATPPAQISTACMDDDGSPLGDCVTELREVGTSSMFRAAHAGMEVQLFVTMTDYFGQRIAGANAGTGIQIEVVLLEGSESPLLISGLRRFWFDAGEASTAGLTIFGRNSSALTGNFNATLLLQVPQVLFAYSYLPPARVPMHFGSCPAGFVPVTIAAGSSCRPCPTGNFVRFGAASCSFCPLGTFSNLTGSSECTPCPLGHKCPTGSSAPIACQQGQYEDQLGSGECKRCELGTFQAMSASTACETCAASHTTAGLGSVLASECACMAGSYSPSPTEECRHCPEGMECVFGSDLSYFFNDSGDALEGQPFPKLLPGYYSSMDDPMNVYKCFLAAACPGGPPGSCGSRSAEEGGFLCMDCPSGSFFDGGECKSCEFKHNVFVLCMVIIGVLVALAIARTAGNALTKQNPQVTLFLMGVSQLLNFLQVSSAIAKLPIRWSNPWKTFGQILAIFNLDVHMFRLECFGVVGNAGVYALQVFMPVVILLAFTCCWGVLHFVRPGALPMAGFVNAIGHFMITLYITFCIVSLAPFHCYSHPNGLQSMVDSPQVLCGATGDHPVMVFTGVCGIVIYPVLIICVIFYSIWIYPTMIASSNTTLITYCRFVFYRWRPECYWFGGLLLIRNLLLPLVPMTLPHDIGDMSAALMQFTLQGVLLATVKYMPWRNAEMNFMDIFLNFMVGMTLFIGSMAIISGSDNLSDKLSYASFALSIACIVVGIAFACRQAVSVLNHHKHYAVFLSHHKSSGACAARLLKYMLHQALRKPIFYDCDDLSSLSEVFTAVKQSRSLCVMLSGETLCRPWCAGEIVTAFQYGVRMVPVALVDEVDRWSSFSPNEQQRLIVEQFEPLRAYGFIPEAVPQAFEALLSISPVRLNLCISAEGLHQAVRDIASQCTGPATLSVPFATTKSNCASVDGQFPPSPSSRRQVDAHPQVLIVCDPDSSEGAAAAHLIRQMLQEKLQMDIRVDLGMPFDVFRDIVCGSTLRASLFILSPSTSLTSGVQLARLGTLFKVRPQAQVMPVIIAVGFVFPEQSYFVGLESGTLECSRSLAAELPDELSSRDVAAALRSLLRGVAKFLNIPMANKADLAVGIGSLADRIRQMWTITPAAQLEGGLRRIAVPPASFSV